MYSLKTNFAAGHVGDDEVGIPVFSLLSSLCFSKSIFFSRSRLRDALAASGVLLALASFVLPVPKVFGQNFPTPSTNPEDFVVGPGTSDQTSDQFSGSLDQFPTDQFSSGRFTTGQPGESTMQDLNISPEQLDQF